MRRVWALAGAAATLAAACGVDAEHRARAADDESVPFELLEPDPTPVIPSAPASAAESVDLCFVLDNQLTVVPALLDAPVGLEDALRALVEPPAEPRSLRTALTDPSVVRQVRLSQGIAQVDLRDAISGLAGDQQLLLVAQIVCTLTGRPGVGQVSFTLEASPVDVPRGDGSLSSDAVSRDDYAALLD